MFIRSAASDTLQGRSIQSVNEKWGEGKWSGTETIGIQVCKKKYAPFCFPVEDLPSGERRVTVQRMFGCRIHSDIRRETIERHGLRTGWEPFGQWSMRKAQEAARNRTEKMNGCADTESSSSESDEEDENNLKTICHDGKCTWKRTGKYDNIVREVTGSSDSDSGSE